MSDSETGSGVEPAAARGTEDRFVILAAIDLSTSAVGVIAEAARLARVTPGAEIHVVHVLDPGELEGYPVTDSYASTLAERRAYLDARSAEANTASRRSVTGHLGEGDPWREIVQTAASLDADLVVVGTHGRRGVSRWVMGSIAEKIVRHAACPVYVVRGKTHASGADAASAQVPEIEPPCPDCLVVQRETHGERLWCARHSQHHPRAHLHYQSPEPFGVGSGLLHPES